MMRTKSIGKRIFYPLLFVLLPCIIIYNVIRIASPHDRYRVIPFKVANGWGYQIVHKDKVVVYQPFIPKIAGKKAFPNKRSASKTGKLMLERLRNHQYPVFSLDDLQQVGLDSLGNFNR